VFISVGHRQGVAKLARAERVSKKLDEDVRIEYDRKGAIVGIEVANTRRNLVRRLSAYIAKRLKAAG